MRVNVYVSYSTPGGQAKADIVVSSLRDAEIEMEIVTESLCEALVPWLEDHGIDTSGMDCPEIIDMGGTYGADAEFWFRDRYAEIRALEYAIDYFKGEPVEERQHISPSSTMIIEVEEEE